MNTDAERLAVIEDRLDIHDRRIAVLEGFVKLFARLLGVALDGMLAQLRKFYGEDL
jgi:hypothetical protein